MTKRNTNSFLNEYTNTKNKSILRKEALTFFENKYYKNPFEAESIFDSEERKLVRKLNFFLPGRIYTFNYNPVYKNQLDYYDLRPMTYVIGEYISKETGLRIMQGINLNFLPERAKVSFLNSVFNVFGKSYEYGEKLSEQERISFMPEIQKFLTNWKFMEDVFNTRYRVGIEFAVRNYFIDRMQKPVLIEWEDYQMIPYYVPKSLQEKPPAYIYNLYKIYRQEFDKVKKPVRNKIKYKKR